MRKLIVNADDFGFSEAVNHGILKAMEDGIVTSTSIMANMPGFAHAAALYHEHPDMAVGVHLNLTCYRPLLSTHKTLVTEPAISISRESLQAVAKKKCTRN